MSVFLTILWDGDINGKKVPDRKNTHLKMPNQMILTSGSFKFYLKWVMPQLSQITYQKFERQSQSTKKKKKE